MVLLGCATACGTSHVVAKAKLTTTDTPAVSESPDKAANTTLRIHYPHADAMSVRGTGPLSWETSKTTRQDDDNTFSIAVHADAAFSCKPLIKSNGTWVWSMGANYTVQPGTTVDIYPRFFTQVGHYDLLFPRFVSYLGLQPRDVWVYYPASYFENTLATYPVLYMHDGQNLFDPALAFGGTEWQVDETLERAEQDGSIREVVVIGIGNTSDRIAEYTPTTDPDYPDAGWGETYLRFITSELMPQVNAHLRVRTDAASTGILGSSLGGLISAYAGTTDGSIFGVVGVMSPSTWWNNNWIIDQVANASGQLPVRVYLDSGDAGDSSDDVTYTAQLAQSYQKRGFAEHNLRYTVGHGDQHNEYFWARRLPGALQFLFGPQ